MPVVRPANAVLFETHGSRFHSFASPSRGSTQLSAWRLDVPAGLRGVAHRPSREEILLILVGELHVTLDDETFAVTPGDVVVVPPTANFASTAAASTHASGSQRRQASRQSPPTEHDSFLLGPSDEIRERRSWAFCRWLSSQPGSSLMTPPGAP